MVGLARGKGEALSPKDWAQVVIVAGIGSVLEWFDFFSYSQLDGTIKKVFFPSDSEFGYWTVFALAMAARPVGALMFGHIGDTAGRSRTLVYGIICMAVATFAIALLPTYDTGSYTAGIAATILLGFFRTMQGLAMGGEYGAAIVYISELASVHHRCTLVAALQTTSQVGLVLALSLVMVLQAVFTTYGMQIWGWRIPFFLAFITAFLGFWLRRGMPEPKAFLEAARKEKLRSSKSFSKRQLMLLGEGADVDADTSGSPADKEELGSAEAGRDNEGLGGDNGEEEPFERAVSMDHGALSSLHSDASHSHVPMFRVLRNNWAGICIQVCYLAWVSGAFYATTSWLPSQLRARGMSTRVSQGILLVSIVPCVLGQLGTGWLLDCGARAIYLHAATIVVGGSAAFGVYYGCFKSTTAAWFIFSALLFVIGSDLTLIGLPTTRIYAPLERITGFSFAYSMAMGVIGGFTPNISNAIKADLSSDNYYFACPIWLVSLAGLSLLGCILMRLYAPRLNKPFVGHLE